MSSHALHALSYTLSGLLILVLVFASDPHTQARCGAGQIAEGGRIYLPTLSSCPNRSNPGHVSQVSSTPPTWFSKLPFRQSSSGAPTPMAIPHASQFDVSETSLAQTCFSPKRGFFSSASICFMQENGRKLCSLIDIQEDVVPSPEIYPSQSGLQ